MTMEATDKICRSLRKERIFFRVVGDWICPLNSRTAAYVGAASVAKA
jgi:hypothetical protein